ncbi:hypothetical protein AHAS_Ahas06G0183700 [Arachis hypogaea]
MYLDGGAQPRRTLGFYSALNADFYRRSISIPPIGVDHFELNQELFFLICDTVKTNGVDLEVYRLMLFLFSVRDQAKNWLRNQPKGSLNTWDKVVDKFLNWFFFPRKLTKLRIDI